MSMMPAPRQNKKRRYGSQGNIAPEDIPMVENHYENILDSLKGLSKIGEGKFGELEDVQQLRDKSKQALETVKTFKGMCELDMNQGCDVKVCTEPPSE
jgi:hypothetical protein